MARPVYFSRGNALPNIMNVLTYLAKMGSSSIVLSFEFSSYHSFSSVCLILVAHSKIENVLLFLLHKALFIMNRTCSHNRNNVNNKDKTLDLLYSLMWRLAAFKIERWIAVFSFNLKMIMWKEI